MEIDEPPYFHASRIISIGDRGIAPRSGERAWFRNPRDGRLYEKFAVLLEGAEVDPLDAWLAVCNECAIPIRRNRLECIGKTVACSVLSGESPEFEGPALEDVPLIEQWSLLRTAETSIDFLLRYPASWDHSDQAMHLRAILEGLRRRLDEVDAGATPTTLCRWRARAARRSH